MGKTEIKIPPMGESISEVIIGSILKESGSHVKMDEEILEIETDKANQAVYAPAKGKLTLSVKPEQTVKIGEVIGHIEESDEKAKEENEPSTEKAAEKLESYKEPEAVKSPQPKLEESKKQEAPKQEAKTQDVRQTKEFFIQELKFETKSEGKRKPVPEKIEGKRTETRHKMSRIRKVIAKRLVEAQQNMAMLTTFNEIDLTEVIKIREAYKEQFAKKYEVKLGFMSFFVKAAVSALHSYPDLNSYIDQEDIVRRDYYDIGIAVGTEKGVLVPVIRNCDQLTFAQIESEIDKYAKAAREGKISADDLKGAGFTITNGGVYGSLLSTPIINPPQSGILGMHKIMKRPVVIEDEITVRAMMYVALSYDHRIIDGREAVLFLVHLKNCLEDPSRILLDL